MKGYDYMKILKNIANIAKFFAKTGDGLASWGIGYQPEDLNQIKTDIERSAFEEYNLNLVDKLSEKE